jgi:hypothetical protein
MHVPGRTDVLSIIERVDGNTGETQFIRLGKRKKLGF